MGDDLDEGPADPYRPHSYRRIVRLERWELKLILAIRWLNPARWHRRRRRAAGKGGATHG